MTGYAKPKKARNTHCFEQLYFGTNSEIRRNNCKENNIVLEIFKAK